MANILSTLNTLSQKHISLNQGDRRKFVTVYVCRTKAVSAEGACRVDQSFHPSFLVLDINVNLAAGEE